MREQPELARMFRYCPETFNLTGFPHSRVLDMLGETFGEEVSLRQYVRSVRGRRFAVPSFPQAYFSQRRAFFNSLPHSAGLLGIEFPRMEDSRYTAKGFLNFCNLVYEAIGKLRKELKDYKHLPEARRVLERVGKFDSDLERTIQALEEVEKASVLAVDAENGVVAPMRKMPTQARSSRYRPEQAGGEIDFQAIRVRMQREALRIAKQGVVDFRKRIVRFAGDQFRYSEDTDNLRRDFEQMAVPARLHARYRRFIDSYKKWLDEFGDVGELPHEVHPRFGEEYRIKNLFPLSLLGERDTRGLVPIDFETRGRRKFLIAGLHSGGKSFFLENIVLASILGQIPLKMFADTLELPIYNRLFYYTNPNKAGSGDGKLLTDMKAITQIIEEAEEGDLVVIDEFLDSGSPEAVTWLSPELLRHLGKLDARVFVSSHRNHDYRELTKDGWTILSPEHRIEKGRVVPAHRLKRGIPDKIINRRFVREKYRDFFRD